MARNSQTKCNLVGHFTPEYLKKLNEEPKFKDLPLDKKGICIFHSKDLEWKYQNQFDDRLNELIQIIEADPDFTSINLNEITLVGIEDFESIEGYRNMGVKSKPFRRIIFRELELSKPLTLKRAIFTDNLLIDFCKFETLDLESSIFKGAFELKSSLITESTSFIRVISNNNFYIEATTFEKIVEFTEAVFNYQFLILDVEFKEQAIFDEVRFTEDDDINYVQINAAFRGYTSFQKAYFRSIVHFANCTFSDETYFINTGFANRLHIDNVSISNNIYFQSKKESAKLFQADVDFDFDETAFSEAGQIIFENTNLFNLNTKFKQNLRNLERLQRVVIRKGCLKYRLSYVFVIQNISELATFLLKDFYQLLSNYFELKYGFTLNVDFEKMDDVLQIVLHSDDDIANDVFEELLETASNELKTILTTHQISNEIKHKEYILEKSKSLSKFSNFFIKHLKNTGFLEEAKPHGKEIQ